MNILYKHDTIQNVNYGQHVSVIQTDSFELLKEKTIFFGSNLININTFHTVKTRKSYDMYTSYKGHSLTITCYNDVYIIIVSIAA